MNQIKTANEIVNHFMHQGAVISKKDFDYVMDLLGADKPMSDECEKECAEEMPRKRTY